MAVQKAKMVRATGFQPAEDADRRRDARGPHRLEACDPLPAAAPVPRALSVLSAPPMPKALPVPSAMPVPSAPPMPSALPIFSREKLLDQLDGDEMLMQRMITLFHENTPRLLNDIRGSIARRGSSDLARSAHGLLSSLGAFGAGDAHQLTQQLEAQAREENYEHAERTFAALERETAEIHATLATFTPARV